MTEDMSDLVAIVERALRDRFSYIDIDSSHCYDDQWTEIARLAVQTCLHPPDDLRTYWWSHNGSPWERIEIGGDSPLARDMLHIAALPDGIIIEQQGEDRTHYGWTRPGVEL